MFLEQCEQQCLQRPVSGFWPRFGHLLQRAGKKIERWAQLAQQCRQLREMDDRMLKDIGLSRSDVDRIAGRRWFGDGTPQSGEQGDERLQRSSRR